MDTYITSNLIKVLREKKHLTQKQLASILQVSEKTISKWESGRGLPDISLIEPLAKALDVSIVELFNGEEVINSNVTANMKKAIFYVCPICGNIINSVGECTISCCGNTLIPQEVEDTSIKIEKIENDIYISINSPMTKKDYISFIAYVTSDKIEIRKLYPEQSPEARFLKAGSGYIYYYNNKEGLYRSKI